MYRQETPVPVLFNKKITLQWHITDQCNLRCTHCYQDAQNTAQSSAAIIDCMIRRIQELNVTSKVHLNITGGEPFLHPQWEKILKSVSANCRSSIGILSNGTCLDKAHVQQLKAHAVRFVQISIDGKESTHDAIRGQGSFKQAMRAIKLLVKYKIRVLVSFTATNKNFTELPLVAHLCRKYRADQLWSDRVIPCGSAQLSDSLTAQQTRDYIRILAQEQKKHYAGNTRIRAHRALQFLLGKEAAYHCHAAQDHFTIMPNGDIYPCRRMPVKIGNIVQTGFLDLVLNSPWIKKFMCAEIPDWCKQCFYKNLCKGGLKCLAFAVYNDWTRADPGCWIAKHTSEEPFLTRTG